MANVNVLLIDDNVFDRKILKSALKAMGFRHIHEADDGSAGDYKVFNAAQMHQPYDLIFVDWLMPKLDGMNLVKRIRAERLTRQTCLIMLTGYSSEEHVHIAIQNGVDDFIIKPLNPTILTPKIERLAEARGWIKRKPA